MPELVFEIGMEEMPARFIRPALDQLRELAVQRLGQQGLLPDGAESDIQVYGTPRRLALVAQGILERQPDRREEILGPPVKNAFDADGNPTKAALGFAKSQGVELSTLKTLESPKGPRLGFIKEIPGRPAGEVLAELLPALVESLHFPKNMRWGRLGFRFARPIHWFLALLDGQVIPFELAGIKSGDQTCGHRFLAPQAITITNGADYLAKLEKAFVLARREQRLEEVRRQVQELAAQAGGRLVPDEALIQENTDLVEYVVACRGTFDPEFLEVPRPVIISAMRSHQRYFSLEDEQGNLLPAFIAVNNTKPRDLAVVTKGHERVLRARLADARFFLDEDLKRPLMDYLEDLKEVTYHAKLGTSYEKVQRFTNLARQLAQQLAPELEPKVQRAALLSKCDLVTEMVGEFPDLQGVIGAEYARRGGEDPQVAQAIEEHYLPAGADSPLPQGMIGTLVGLADRLDTICGLFGIGEKPSGAADPFGLRRAAIAVIRLVVEKELTLSLSQALDWALEGLAPWLKRPAGEVAAEVTGFFAARFQGLLAEQGVPTDVARAVLAAGLDDLAATRARALALAAVKDSPEFLPLAVGMKRVMNILRKEAGQVPQADPDQALMQEEAEKALYTAFLELEQDASRRFAEGDFAGFLQGVAALKEPIDRFFDDVMVMVEDEALRRNRLALLKRIAGLFERLAQFTHLQLA